MSYGMESIGLFQYWSYKEDRPLNILNVPRTIQFTSSNSAFVSQYLSWEAWLKDAHYRFIVDSSLSNLTKPYCLWYLVPHTLFAHGLN